MRKTMKRVIACALAAALSLGTALTSMAATPSPVVPKEPEKQVNVGSDDKFYKVNTETSGELAIVASKTVKKAKKTVPAKISVGGVKYTVTAVAPNAFKTWSKVKTLILPNTVKTIKAKAFTGCKSLKTIVLKNKKAAKVAKNSFKGLNTKKMSIKVKAKMTTKEYKKLQTNLRKAGFKGKISK
ncbi:MAG: leucine-rich repeat protein [Lachnospiraceae bacterium]|nr:leucine-rich repeat protein [Lachnospiraceae bacterium]